MNGRAPTGQAPGKTEGHTRSAFAAFNERSIFEKMLVEHQDEIQRLSEELKAERRENAELKKKLLAAQAGMPVSKRKRSGGKVEVVELDYED